MWFYSKDRKTKRGPYSFGQIKSLARSGTIGPDDLVQRPKGGWIAAKSVAGLFDEAPAESSLDFTSAESATTTPAPTKKSASQATPAPTKKIASHAQKPNPAHIAVGVGCLAVLGLLVLIGFFVGNTSSPSQPKKGLVVTNTERPQGTWSGSNGAFSSFQEVWVFERDSLTRQSTLTKDMGLVKAGKRPVDYFDLTLYPEKSPKRFLATLTQGATTGQELRGIYEIKNSELSICYAVFGPHIAEDQVYKGLTREGYPERFYTAKETAAIHAKWRAESAVKGLVIMPTTRLVKEK